MDSQSRFGRQPFVVELFIRRLSIRAAARNIGFDLGYTHRVAVGRVAPSAEFRRAMSQFLQRTEAELFTPEVLDLDYVVRSNARGLRRADDSDAGVR